MTRLTPARHSLFQAVIPPKPGRDARLRGNFRFPTAREASRGRRTRRPSRPAGSPSQRIGVFAAPQPSRVARLYGSPAREPSQQEHMPSRAEISGSLLAGNRFSSPGRLRRFPGTGSRPREGIGGSRARRSRAREGSSAARKATTASGNAPAVAREASASPGPDEPADHRDHHHDQHRRDGDHRLRARPPSVMRGALR